MNTPNPEGGDVRPSIDIQQQLREAAQSLIGLARVIRQYGTCAPAAIDLVAGRVDNMADMLAYEAGRSCGVGAQPRDAGQREDAGCEDAEDRACTESDGCPTELAVLKRFWRSKNKATLHLAQQGEDGVVGASASRQAHNMLIDLRAAAAIGRPITGDEIHELEQELTRALSESAGGDSEPLGYTAIFNAIAAATWPAQEGVAINVSVAKFHESIGGNVYAAPARAPGGDFVLVPREPTEEMLSAMDMCLMAGPADAYRAMIAAAGGGV